ncbi:MAG: hypothetical protein NT069_10020 [Planctomycetota bacterium]|nr:hypothetical protein [Planctomycetota bacterium]
MKRKFNWLVGLLLSPLACVLLSPPPVQAALPATGYVTNYSGVPLSGQCVPSARSLAAKLVTANIPALGANGVAADLWNVATPDFSKVPRLLNGQVRIPPEKSFIIWSRAVGGTGHVAMVVGVVDGPRRIVRVVDTNWGLDGRGQIHDVNLDNANILGYLIKK